MLALMTFDLILWHRLRLLVLVYTTLVFVSVVRKCMLLTHSYLHHWRLSVLPLTPYDLYQWCISSLLLTPGDLYKWRLKVSSDDAWRFVSVASKSWQWWRPVIVESSWQYRIPRGRWGWRNRRTSRCAGLPTRRLRTRSEGAGGGRAARWCRRPSTGRGPRWTPGSRSGTRTSRPWVDKHIKV